MSPFRRSNPAAAPEERCDPLERAWAVFERHGVDSLSPFILRRDKQFLFGADGALAFRSIGRTMIVSGDPVGPEDSVPKLLGQLLERAQAGRRRVIVYGASGRYLDIYRSLGMRVLCTGEEAVVRPSGFTLEGRAVRKLRQSVHRASRRGWRVEVLRGSELDGPATRGLKDLDAAWRALCGECRGFAMATGDPAHVARPDDVFALAFSPEGRLSAAMRFLAHTDRLSLDTMQRVGETTNGLNEALICHVLAYARERGIAEVSLNYAGLAHLVRRAPAGGPLRRALTRLLLRVLRSRFQMDRLVMFNEKFHPEWRPRYLVYGSRASLPLAILRVLQAEGYLPDRHAGVDLASHPGWVSPAARAAGQPLSA